MGLHKGLGLIALCLLAGTARAELPATMRDFAGHYRLACGGQMHRLVLGRDGSLRLDGQAPSATDVLTLSTGPSNWLDGPVRPGAKLELFRKWNTLYSITQDESSAVIKLDIKACVLSGGTALPHSNAASPLAVLAQHQRLRCTVKSQWQQQQVMRHSGIDAQAEISAAGVGALTPAWVPTWDKYSPILVYAPPAIGGEAYELLFRQHYRGDGVPADWDYQANETIGTPFGHTSNILEFDAEGGLRRWRFIRASEGIAVEWDCRG